mmetsp:Transcript_49713/g.88871  ORF Transcript_49713/g.88871 Transcript_49713/m.88871 type:complete len:402 (-) Transcript_49713:193-1398(-)
MITCLATICLSPPPPCTPPPVPGDCYKLLGTPQAHHKTEMAPRGVLVWLTLGCPAEGTASCLRGCCVAFLTLIPFMYGRDGIHSIHPRHRVWVPSEAVQWDVLHVVGVPVTQLGQNLQVRNCDLIPSEECPCFFELPLKIAHEPRYLLCKELLSQRLDHLTLRLRGDVLGMAVLPWAEAQVQARGPGPGQVIRQCQHGLHFELGLGIRRVQGPVPARAPHPAQHRGALRHLFPIHRHDGELAVWGFRLAGAPVLEREAVVLEWGPGEHQRQPHLLCRAFDVKVSQLDVGDHLDCGSPVQLVARRGEHRPVPTVVPVPPLPQGHCGGESRAQDPEEWRQRPGSMRAAPVGAALGRPCVRLVPDVRHRVGRQITGLTERIPIWSPQLSNRLKVGMHQRGRLCR